MNKIRQIRKVIQKERIYIWMLIFILGFNAFNLISHSPSAKELVKAKDKTRVEEASPVYQRLSDIKQEDLKAKLEENTSLAKLLGFIGLLVALIIIAGIALDIKFIFPKAQGKDILVPLTTSVKAGWQILDIGKVIILFLFFGYLISIVELVILHLITKGKIDKNLFMVLNTSLMDIFAIGAVIYFITKKYKQNLSSIGLSGKKITDAVLVGIKSYLGMLPVILIVLFIIIWLSNIFNYQPPIQPIFELFLQEERSALVMCLTIFVTLVGPIAEEIFFRGFAYRALREKLGVFKAIALTSLVFAALHTNLVGFFPILILGILLAYLAQKTNSIIPSITVHVLHNTVILSFLLLTKKIVGLM